MTNFFYSLPLWLATILVLGVALLIGMGGSAGLRHLFRIKATDEEKEVAINLMQVVAAYVGIMIAFAGVQVWQDFSEAQAAVSREANTAASLYQDLTVYGSDTIVARGALRSYVRSIVEDEWPRLQEGKGSPIADAALMNVFNEVGRLRPDDDQKSAIYDQALSRLHDLIDLRRDRIIESQNGIPVILWAIGLVGSLLTVSYASAFTPTRYNLMMIAGISITLGLVFLFILTVDYPYKGEFSISNRALLELPAEFAKLDQNAVTFPAPARLRAAIRR